MDAKKLLELSDTELLAEAKKIKRNNFLDASFVGFLAGVVVYSLFNQTFGGLMLIPLYLIYRLIQKPKYKKEEIDQILAERGLKL